MIYIILFIIISILTFIFGIYKNKSKMAFTFISIIITFMSMFRYGSGTDYFAYMWHYNINPSSIFDSILYKSNMNIGYRVIMGISKEFNISFEVFILCLSIIVCTIFFVTIAKNSYFPIMSLLVFYGVYFHIYVNSALRQGIAMAIFIWALLYFYKNGKVVKYIIFIIIASLFHYSVLITLMVPFLQYLYKKYFENYRVNIVLFMIGIASFIFGGEKVIVYLTNIFGISIGYEATGANILAILLRIIMLLTIWILYRNSNKNLLTQFDKLCIYIYFINTILFIAISNMSVLSRLTEYFSLLDIFIIPNLISRCKFKIIKVGGILFVIILIVSVFIKDQYSFIEQGEYFNRKLLSYPYVTIFNKDDIYKYRNINSSYILR